ELVDARLVVISIPQPSGRLRIEAISGEPSDLEPGTELPDRSKSQRVLARRHRERVDSLLDDPEVDQESTRRMGVQTAIYVPLVVRDRAIGVVAVHDKVGADPRFSDDDVRLAEAFAARAAVAVEISQRVARDAMQRVVTAQELERRRLARELHDETGQALTSILLGLKTVEEAGDLERVREAVASLRELTLATLRDVRRLALELRPKALDDFGLAPALERLTDTFAEQTGLAVDFQPLPTDERLPGDVETALYRIVQEALTNIVKHAHARSV